MPSPLPTVISELQRFKLKPNLNLSLKCFIYLSAGLVMTRADFEKDNQSWLQWGANLISPSSWLQGFVGSSLNKQNSSQLVHIPVLKVRLFFCLFKFSLY